MVRMNDIFLSQFNPRSELIVKEHEITRAKFPVIDFHTHYREYEWINFSQEELDKVAKVLQGYGVVNVINLDNFWGKALDNAIAKMSRYSDLFTIFGSVDASKIDEPEFHQYVYNTIIEGVNKGIKGLKFFKSLGLEIRDKLGNLIRVDDNRLKPIWTTAAEFNLPVLIHIADPIAFFKPIDGNNERFDELNLHPNWSYASDEFPRFEELMEMQENLLANNPETTFVIAHVGSMAENLEWVSQQMDRYPNMYIDIAERIAELGRQPYTSRKFFIKYQDRILFGTDGKPNRDDYKHYFRFLETWDEYFDYKLPAIQGRWKIYGIGLPDEILKKVYYGNAIKLIPSLASRVNNLIKE